jgi:protein-tyrosine phosphatase
VLGDLFDAGYVAELDEHLESVDDVADHYTWSYLDFLERYRDRFGTAVAAIADAGGPVVVHCMGGKDRTGLVAALLLRLAGVDRETIGHDYSLSSANLAPVMGEWVESAADDAERRKRQKLSDTPAVGMVRVIEEIEARYGDVASYLLAAGLSPAQLERLRERLVSP